MSGPCAPGQPCFCFGQTYCYQRLTITFPANPSFQLPAASVEKVSLSKLPRQCLMWPQDISVFQNQVPGIHPQGSRAHRIELNAVSQNYVDIFARTVVYSGSLFSNSHLSDAYIRAGAAFTVDIELIGERLMLSLLPRLQLSQVVCSLACCGVCIVISELCAAAGSTTAQLDGKPTAITWRLF